MSSAFLSPIKTGVTSVASAISTLLPTQPFYLAVDPAKYDAITREALERVFEGASSEQKIKAFHIRWDLGKMENPTIEGADWGRDHFWDSIPLAARAAHRAGILGEEGVIVIRYGARVIDKSKAPGASFYSLGEKLGRDPALGQIGYINGMGSSIAHAGRDAASLSDSMASGMNLHCVHLPSQQSGPTGDPLGFVLDTMRHLMTDGGSYTRAPCLVAQQWIDYLDLHPERFFLQLCASEGGSHVNAALRLLRTHRPDLLSRLRIIALAPACFMEPQTEDIGLQIVNLVKKEDGTILPVATHADLVGRSPFVRVIPHTVAGDPHNFTTVDYAAVAKPMVDLFIATGNIY